MPNYTVTPPLSTSSNTEDVVFGGYSDHAEPILLGRLNETGPIRNVFIDTSSELVVAIVGKRGTGKSYSLGVLAEGLCAALNVSSIGRISRRKAAILFDTLNVFWTIADPFNEESAVSRARFAPELSALREWGLKPAQTDASVWVPKGYARPHELTLFSELSLPISELTVDDIADLIEIDLQRDLMGQLLSEVYEKAKSRPQPRTFDDYIQVVGTDQELVEYYARGTIRGLIQRLRSAAQMSVFAKDGTPLTALLKPGHLAIIELGGVPNQIRTVIASVLIKRIHTERSEASDIEKQLSLNIRLPEPRRIKMQERLSGLIPPSWVLIDEAQNLLPDNRSAKSTDALVRFVREGRNFGLSMAVATQQPTSLDSRILAQVDTIIAHQLTIADDINSIRQNLKSQEPAEMKLNRVPVDMPGLLRGLARGEAIVTNTETSRLFVMKFRPRISPHAGVGSVATVAINVLPNATT